MSRCLLFSICCASALSLPAFAQNSWLPTWEVTGFGTLGYAQVDKYDDRVLRRNVSQSGEQLADNGFLVDSRFGVQVNGELNDNWDFVAQAVLKEQFSQNIEDYIQALFVRYQASNEWQISLGRQPFDLFLLSDHNNVGYSFDWVRPPTQFYGHLPYDSFDGLKIAYHWGDFDQSWQLSLSVGNLEEQFDTLSFAPPDDYALGQDVTKASPIYNVALHWISDNWHFRANYAHLDFEQELQDFEEVAMIFDYLGFDARPMLEQIKIDNKLNYTSVGFSWEPDNLKIQAEYSITSEGSFAYGGKRGYVHVANRFGNWLPFLTYGFAIDDSNYHHQPPENTNAQQDMYIEMIRRGAEEMYTSQRNNEKSLTLGIRWDFANQQNVKFQCDRFFFDANSSSIHGRVDNKYLNNETKTWCSASYDWVF